MAAAFSEDDRFSDADPLDLNSVDQQIRINELRAQAEDLGLGEGYVNPDSPPELEEHFLRQMIDYEKAPLSTDFQRLQSAGIDLPAPETLDDAAVTAKLWEVIHALAAINTFLHGTDHMSDRGLYEQLWSESLREESPSFPPGSGWNHHIDPISGGSDEDNEMYLRYYASDESRTGWKRDFPDEEIPPHEEPPYKRAHLLPQPPPPPEWKGMDVPDEDE